PGTTPDRPRFLSPAGNILPQTSRIVWGDCSLGDSQMRKKKRGGGGRREFGSTEKVAKELARNSQRLHRGAAELVGKIEEIESGISRVHEETESFHESTEEIEKNLP